MFMFMLVLEVGDFVLGCWCFILEAGGGRRGFYEERSLKHEDGTSVKKIHLES